MPADSAIANSSMAKPVDKTDERYWKNRSPLISILRFASALLPGEYLKTALYLNCIDLPRRALRQTLFAFYRFDHVYSVLGQFRREILGNASILEFGTSDGYAFVKLLYATRYLGIEERVEVHTFDSFEGMPAPADEKDREWITGDNWVPGEFKGRYQALIDYCRRKGYRNSRIHRGYFEQTLDRPLLQSLEEHPPILIWIDCDYYSSARTAIERLIDRIPNGCVIYFDELDNLNFGSRLTGEARIVHELNTGEFGESIELVPDLQLSLHSRRIYRFFRIPPNRMLNYTPGENSSTRVRRHGDGSPLP
jgi:hypothetical protein